MKSDLIHIIYPILTLIIGILVSLVSIPKIISWAQLNNKLDVPNWRSSHKAPVPSYGGISFNLSIIICTVLFISTPKPLIFIGCLISIGIIGYLDDSINLKASRKFMAQFIIASIIYSSGFQILSLQGIFGIYEIPAIISYLVTLVLIVGVTNAYNLIDGVDGLAGSLGIISSLTFSVIFFYLEKTDFMIISLALSGSILGFLKFNFSPAKIFMGDSGSLVLGLALSVLFIEALSCNHSTVISASASTLLIPCIDMLRLFISRLSKKVSPFKADNNHYHHLLIKNGDSHRKVSLTALLVTALFLVLSLVLDNYYSLGSNLIVLLMVCSTLFIWIEFRFYLLSKKQDQILQNSILKIVGENNLLSKKL